MALLKGGGAVLVVILFGHYLLSPLYRMISAMRSAELFVATTHLMILGTGCLMSLAGLSMELGALLAGLLLAETAMPLARQGATRLWFISSAT